MKYTLIGSVRSPFVRICRIFMFLNKIEFTFNPVDFVNDKEDAKKVNAMTPINRVPILLDGNEKIYDSRIILYRLIKNHNLQELSLEEENLISIIYSCIDSGVTLFLMRKDGFDLDIENSFFLNRTKKRIPDGLQYMHQWYGSLDPKQTTSWSLAAISLYCFLYWADKRDLINLEQYPDCKKFIENFSEAPGVKETSF